MARRVFFSFHFERDIFRANQVRQANVVAGLEEAGFFDESEYLDAAGRGEDAIRRLLRAKIERSSVTVVLIGSQTASRDWVRWEIEESVRQGNGLLGVRIHALKAPAWPGGPWLSDLPGVIPATPYGTYLPVMDWDPSDLSRFRGAVEDAAGRGSNASAPRSLRLSDWPLPTAPPPTLDEALRRGFIKRWFKK